MSQDKTFPQATPKHEDESAKQSKLDDGQLSDDDLAKVSGGRKKAAPAAAPAAPAPMM